MRQISAVIDSIPITLNVPEELKEFREGVRLSGGRLQEHEGYLFNFKTPSILYFENSGVDEDITLLFFNAFIDEKMGVVSGVKSLKAQSTSIVSSENPYAIALELRADFCITNKIGEGSILSIQEEE